MGNAMEITGAALIVLAAVLGFLVGKKQKQADSPKNKGSGIATLCGESRSAGNSSAQHMTAKQGLPA